MFSNPSIQSTFNQSNGTSITELYGFGMFPFSDTVYYGWL